jgi:hypothetical protein
LAFSIRRLLERKLKDSGLPAVRRPAALETALPYGGTEGSNPVPSSSESSANLTSSPGAAIVGHQPIALAIGRADAPIYDRARLGAGDRIAGPGDPDATRRYHPAVARSK